MALIKRPGSIRLGGRRWTFKARPEHYMLGATGYCNYDSATLDILAGQHPVDDKDTALHEVLHAILYCQGRENGGEVEEAYVRAISTGLIGALQDNPAFARWLCTPIPNDP